MWRNAAARRSTSTLGFAKKMVATPQQRLPLWRAFSEFFLDTELDAVSFEYVAREIRASGLSLAEAESVPVERGIFSTTAKSS